MKLSDLIDLCTALLTASTVYERAAHGEALARGVRELLGTAWPSGPSEPGVVEPPGDGTEGVVVIHLDNPGVYVADEARGIAIGILNACCVQ